MELPDMNIFLSPCRLASNKGEYITSPTEDENDSENDLENDRNCLDRLRESFSTSRDYLSTSNRQPLAASNIKNEEREHKTIEKNNRSNFKTIFQAQISPVKQSFQSPKFDIKNSCRNRIDKNFSGIRSISFDSQVNNSPGDNNKYCDSLIKVPSMHFDEKFFINQAQRVKNSLDERYKVI